MVFVKTFKGYEDKTAQLDQDVNGWIASNGVDIVAVNTVMSHEPNARSGSGDLLQTIIYRADQPID